MYVKIFLFNKNKKNSFFQFPCSFFFLSSHPLLLVLHPILWLQIHPGSQVLQKYLSSFSSSINFTNIWNSFTFVSFTTGSFVCYFYISMRADIQSLFFFLYSLTLITCYLTGYINRLGIINYSADISHR